MLPVIAIVGRPNVGKSTLFNALTRSRDALVADEPGVTRDRQFGIARAAGRAFVVVDTGGLESHDAQGIARLVSEQSLLAVEESDVVVLVTDARAGLAPQDLEIVERLRASGKPLLVAANKCDGLDEAGAIAEFHSLGAHGVHAIAAAHRRGVRPLIEAALDHAPPPDEAAAPGEDGDGAIRVCVLGRPNVGKSTLVNRLVGEERVIAHDMPGTTRDSVDVPFRHAERDYVLVDTAGVRRRSRVHDRIELFSVVKTLQALAGSDVAVVMIDAREGFTEQDAHLVGYVIDAGRALCVAVNKWDAVHGEDRDQVRAGLERGLTFVDYARTHNISALRGRGIEPLLECVEAAWAAGGRKLPTPELTRVLHEAVERNPPPIVRGRRIKLRYAHQGGSRPPVVIVHGNQTADVPAAYRRYLTGVFRRAFSLQGTPVVVEFKTGNNPFKGRRNPLTPRQQRKRQRLIRHVKR